MGFFFRVGGVKKWIKFPYNKRVVSKFSGRPRPCLPLVWGIFSFLRKAASFFFFFFFYMWLTVFGQEISNLSILELKGRKSSKSWLLLDRKFLPRRTDGLVNDCMSYRSKSKLLLYELVEMAIDWMKKSMMPSFDSIQQFILIYCDT